jgi:tetrahydromethanopterin S-methyltransferase subunit E
MGQQYKEPSLVLVYCCAKFFGKTYGLLMVGVLVFFTPWFVAWAGITSLVVRIECVIVGGKRRRHNQ